MKTLFIVITALFVANSALAKSLKLEDFFGGDEIHLFDLCKLINDFHLHTAVRENDLGLLRESIMQRNTYAANLYFTLASQNKYDWDAIEKQSLYVENEIGDALAEGSFTIDEIMNMKNQCIQKYYVRTFYSDVKLQGRMHHEYITGFNQIFFKHYGLMSE